jgi:uncharacterized membrane protein YdfJ with MMPL/SSD domain
VPHFRVDRHGGSQWREPVTGSALSMDYEVFLLARIREEYDRTGSTTDAVVTGIGRTGRLVTSAALILFLAMAALASAPLTFLKVFATGIGAGILLDATVVRSLLVPALVSLLGDWNWWLPPWAARILRVPARAPLGLPRPLPAPARRRSYRARRERQLTCSFIGVSDGIRTHDIQDHNLAL